MDGWTDGSDVPGTGRMLKLSDAWQVCAQPDASGGGCSKGTTPKMNA